jgi:TolB protein
MTGWLVLAAAFSFAQEKDETRIVFIRSQGFASQHGRGDEGFQLWVFEKGKESRLDEKLHKFLPVASPDGKRLAFATGREGSPGLELCVSDADGKNVKQLTTKREVGEFRWSPDSRRLLFTARSGGAGLFVIGVDGTNEKRLSPAKGEEGWQSPAWSPDGRRIAFVRWRPPGKGGALNEEICVADADGADVKQLTDDGAIDRHPAWSPDGKRIAFTSYKESAEGDLCVMDADGGARVNLTKGTGRNSQPMFSPDGASILFLSGGRDDAPGGGLYRMKSDGSGVTLLAKDVGAVISWTKAGR